LVWKKQAEERYQAMDVFGSGGYECLSESIRCAVDGATVQTRSVQLGGKGIGEQVAGCDFAATKMRNKRDVGINHQFR